MPVFASELLRFPIDKNGGVHLARLHSSAGTDRKLEIICCRLSESRSRAIKGDDSGPSSGPSKACSFILTRQKTALYEALNMLCCLTSSCVAWLTPGKAPEAPAVEVNGEKL